MKEFLISLPPFVWFITALVVFVVILINRSIR